jgi:hypothetical protein
MGLSSSDLTLLTNAVNAIDTKLFSITMNENLGNQSTPDESFPVFD